MAFHISRDLSSPIERVWAAWTTADDLQRWYSPGPQDWTVDELDVRVGGRFRMHMRTPEGQHVAQGTYSVVDPPHLLKQGPDDGSMTIETRLQETQDGTRMEVAMPGLPADQHAMMHEAWSAGFDKLESLLRG